MNTTTPNQLYIVKQASQYLRDSRPKVRKLPLYLWEIVKSLWVGAERRKGYWGKIWETLCERKLHSRIKK